MSIVPFPLPTREAHTRAVVAAAWLVLPISFGLSGVAAWYWARGGGELARKQAKDMIAVALCVGCTLAMDAAAFIGLVAMGVSVGAGLGHLIGWLALPLFLWMDALVLGFTGACVLQAIHTLDPVERAWPAAEEFVETVVIPRVTRRRGLLMYCGARVPTTPSAPAASE